MAADLVEILENLNSFHSVAGQTVVHVGAGGGQFIDYSAVATSVVAIDSDAAAVAALTEAVQTKGLVDRVRVVHVEFESFVGNADIFVFEFCLHEMADPAAALLHARACARQTLIMDHSPESAWAWYLDETEKATRSWRAVEELGVERQADFDAVQRFADYAELVDKVRILGEPALTRIREFEGRRDIEIPMAYRAALVEVASGA
jgi:tRNA G37 N-methylase Trm5